jgi:DNA replication and repair protein RecF
VFNWHAGHLTDVQVFEKVLKNRNALLRDVAEGARPRAQADDLLSVYDAQLAQVAARLTASRVAYLGAIAPHFAAAFEAITHSGRSVALTYETPAPVHAAGTDADALAAALRELLRTSRGRDLARGATTVGPHLDDLSFELDGRAASSYASQGQLRALVLAWKTAEMDLLSRSHGDSPVLLLDDVSSELDATRNAYLFKFLRSRDSQCFITTTHPRHVLVTRDRHDFVVVNGMISLNNS